MSSVAASQAWRWVFLVLLVLAGAALVWKVLPVVDWVTAGIERIDDMGVWGPFVGCLCFALLGTLSFPTTPLYLSAGMLFGFQGGFLVGFPAGVTASLGSFLIARHWAHESWSKRLKDLPRFEELLGLLEEESFKVMFLSRLSPFLPASLKNYGFGLTNVSFPQFALATALGQIPVAATYVYLGWAGGEAMFRDERELTGTELAMLLAGAVASVRLLVLVTWRATRVLRSKSA